MKEKMIKALKALADKKLIDEVKDSKELKKMSEDDLKVYFVDTLESIPESKESDIPDEISDLFNEVVNDLPEEEGAAETKTETKKSKEDKKAMTAKDKKKDAKKTNAKAATPAKKEATKDTKKVDDKKKPAAKKAEAKKGVEKVGVISTIIELLHKGPIKKEKIVDTLIKKFPDRNPDGMKSTVNIQLGGRLAKEKGLKIVSSDKGYSIE